MLVLDMFDLVLRLVTHSPNLTVGISFESIQVMLANCPDADDTDSKTVVRYDIPPRDLTVCTTSMAFRETFKRQLICGLPLLVSVNCSLESY